MNKTTLEKYLSLFTLKPIQGNFEYFIYPEERLRKMELMLLVGENFGIAGNSGTGKSSLLNYLEKIIINKRMGTVVKISEILCNEDVFYKKLLAELLLKVNVKKVFQSRIDEIKKLFYATESLTGFLKDLIYYEPRKKVDHTRLIELYRNFVKEELEKSKDIGLMLNTYMIKKVIAEIFRKTPKRLYILIDDYDKYMLDPYGKEGGENRLGLFLSTIKELTEFSKTTWVFALPIDYYDKYYIRLPFKNNLNFAGLFSEVFNTHNFNYLNFKRYIILKLNSINIELKDFIKDGAIKLLYVISKGNPKMLNYLIRNSLLTLYLRKGKIINEDDVLEQLMNYGKYDKRDFVILKHITEISQTFSNDKELLKKLGIENVALLFRLNKLKDRSLLKSKFIGGIKYFYLNFNENE